MVLFRSLLIASLVAAASAGFAEDTCGQPDWVPQDNTDSPTGNVRCCATEYGEKPNGSIKYASCDTSSCINNFNAKNHNCFNYGAPQNGGQGNKPNQGSAICPYADTDHAICDTSYYNELNGANCRANPDKNNQVHCLGKVKCNVKQIVVPKNGHSLGLSDHDDSGETECLGASGGFSAGDDCFYDGASENWKVCGGDPTPEELQEVLDNPDPVTEIRTQSVVVDPVVDPTPDPLSPEDISTEKAFTKGDPHFKTFGGEMYDYHGECDLVLLHNPEFKDNLGMDIHIRTKIDSFWSSVESAAMRIGDETLELHGGKNDQWLFVNGEANEVMEENTWYHAKISGFLVRYQWHGPIREVKIYFGDQETMLLKTYQDFVRVDIDWKDSKLYDNSLGMLGSRALDGLRVGRDGKTHIADFNEFGQEWQVKEDEPQLFHSYEGVVRAPNMCVLPPTETQEKQQLRRRRLAESNITYEMVQKACAHLQQADEIKACEYDVLATQDLEMAGAW